MEAKYEPKITAGMLEAGRDDDEDKLREGEGPAIKCKRHCTKKLGLIVGAAAVVLLLISLLILGIVSVNCEGTTTPCTVLCETAA